MERYEILKVLGVGSFGKVYLVRHHQERKLACAKMIKIKNIPRKERDVCRNEVDLLQKLEHPNIVGYKDSFLTPRKEHLCIIMEYCDGGDLSTQIKHARNNNDKKAPPKVNQLPVLNARDRRQLFPENKILHWFVQIALGLHFMHSRLILHRDIKTENIFLLGNGRLVLGDLGISKVLEGTADFASTRIGTPYYMSPELLESKPYNHKSDIWALGCVLYEITALTYPFNATSLQGLAQRISTGRYPPINIKYSRNLRELIALMLSTSPAQRPDLDQILQLGFIRKHIHNFMADIVSRETNKMGTGTMVLKAAAVNMVADAEGPPNVPGSEIDTAVKVLESNKEMLSLKRQLEELGLQAEVKRALKPPEAIRPANVRAAAKIAKEQTSALDREEDRRKAIESALARVRKEREDYSRLMRGNGNRYLQVEKLSPPSSPSRSAKNAAPKHSKAQDGWQAAVVGVGIGRRGRAPGGEVAGGRRMDRSPETGGNQGKKTLNGSVQSPAASPTRESRRLFEARNGRQEPNRKNLSHPQVRPNNFVIERRKDDTGVGKAAAAGGGRGSGGANKVRSDQRGKDLDNLNRRAQAERLEVEAMAKREEEAQREAARKREEALRREWENDRLRKDKVELDRKMIEREERRRKAASVRNCARAADGNRVHRQGGSRPKMEAACGAIAKSSERPFAAVESRKTGAAAAVSPSPSPPPVVRTRARWVKRPYVAASPGPPSLREAIQQLRGEMPDFEAGVKLTEKNGARGSSKIGVRSPIPPSSPAKSPAHASSADKKESLSKRLVSPTSPHSSSEDSEDIDALHWGGGGKGKSTVNTRSSAERKKDGVSPGYQWRRCPDGRGEGGGTDEADEDLHAREEILEIELRAATNRCKELRYTLKETKSMIPPSTSVVVDGSEPLDREITETKSVSPPRSSLPRRPLSVVEDDESEDVDDEEEDYSTKSGLSLRKARESRNNSNIRGRDYSRNSARNGLRNGESGDGLQGDKGGNIGVDEGGEQATQSCERSYFPAKTGRKFCYQGDRSRTKSEAKAPDGTGIGDINAWQARYPRLPPSALTGLTSSLVSSAPTPSDAACKETQKVVTRENKPTSCWKGGGVVVAGRSGRSSDVITRTPREDSNSISPRVDRRGRSQDGRSSEIGSPRVCLSPPSPPPSVPTGKLADRIRMLRERCQLGLGTDTFDRAYRYLKDQEPDTPNGEGAMFFSSDDREERLLQGFTDLIGQDKARYYWLIDQLIFIEDAYMGSGF